MGTYTAHGLGKAALAAVTGLAALAIASPASAAVDCGALARSALGHGTVTSATLVAPGAFTPPPSSFGPPPGVANAAFKTLPAFCRVAATLTPMADSDIKVEVWLPASEWNGKFVGIGNGIWAGQISYAEMGPALARGYAVAATDTGHVGNGLTAEFAVGHPEKLVDFAYRAVHEMTVTAKQLVRDFYGSAPKLSFWNSCSTGGRQGLMAAHRYPDDYDAISAMAPANPMTDLMTQTMWVAYQALRTPAAALTPAKLGMVHKAVVAQCDAADGLKDGLIGRPDACHFDPGVLQCKAGESADCLNADQVTALRGIYGGVRDASGKQLLPGFPVGSELQLALLLAGPEPFPVATSYFRMLVFADQPNWDWRKMDYGQDVVRSRAYGGEMLNIPPDGLQAFFARGGKLLLSHGWADGLIPANNTLAFYRGLYQALPAKQAEESLRLFMAPGMNHCRGGEGPSAFDTLGTIDHWRSDGVAPERIVATRVADPTPGAAKLPPLSRPLCPFPTVAKYKGSGSPDEAENFVCAPAN
jgi:hypothetical protein